jgi:hypothetical protein
LRTPELEEKRKKYDKRHIDYFGHFENKNHQSEKKNHQSENR